MNACQNMIQTMMINEINRQINSDDFEEEEEEDISQTVLFTPVQIVFRSYSREDS